MAAMIEAGSDIRRAWRWFAVVWLLIAGMATVAAGEWARRDARTAALDEAATAAALHTAVLRSELERHRSLPLVLAQDPDMLAAVTAPSPERVERLNRKLEGLAVDVRAAVIYLLDERGTTVAASNWREPISFVGVDYGFRPYFRNAMETGEGDFFGLGTRSGRPGLYLAERISDASGRARGVIVAKVEFDAMEAGWRASGKPTYVADPNGLVLITTEPDWRFGALRPMSAAQRERLSQAHTSGAVAVVDLPVREDGPPFTRIGDPLPPDLYARATLPGPSLGWTVHLLSPAGEAMTRAVFTARALALLSVALLAGAAGVWLRRRQRARLRASEDEAARLELERQIDRRTVELRDANSLLSHEIEERRRLEKSRSDLQDELIQANKLATLGQIAAGVAHEINQPLAAIRTHADTAGLHLERSDVPAVSRSLGVIGGLTERIGAITDELRAFSRKTRSEAVAVNVDAAIDGALLLAGPRLRERGIRLDRAKAPRGLAVRAERNRLEQVVLNLLQNAIEALDGIADPVVSVSIEPRDDAVVIRVADNGPGLSEAVRERLFTPFTTSKRDGMGLGLVISRDIVAGFGGDLTHEPSPTGAVFSLQLPRAS